MKRQKVGLWAVLLVWMVLAALPVTAQDGGEASFTVYVPLAVTDAVGGQGEADCPYLPAELRYLYTPASDQTGGFHRHAFLVDYLIEDPAYMHIAAEYQVTDDPTLSDLVLTGITPDDGLPSATLRFGEYSRTPTLQNGVTYYWRVRLLCTDRNGDTQTAAWTAVESVVMGE